MTDQTTAPDGVVSSNELGNNSVPKRDAGEVMARGLQEIARRFGHIYWSAGEDGCPNEILAPNGELFKLRCKKCGEDNPAVKWCRVESLPNTNLEDAQGEIRALRATEAGLRERVKELEKGLRRATDALDSLTDKVDGTGFAESDEFNNALDEIDLGRALLEKKE